MADSIRGTVAAAKDAVAASETLMRILLLGKTLWDQKSGESPDVPVGQELNLFQRSLEDNIQVLNSKTVGLGNSAVWALEGLQGDLKEAAKEAHKILGKGFFESIWDANRSYAEVKLLKEKALTPYQVALLFVALTVELENKDKQDEFQGGLARLQSLLRAQTIFNASALKGVVKTELEGLWRPVYSEIRQSQPHKIDEGIFFIKATELQTDDVKTFFGDVLAELEDEKERRAPPPPPPPPAATATAPSGAASSAGGRSSRKKVPATDTLKWYHDPITWELMCDPVKASDGRTYDRWTFIDHGSSMKRSPFDRREDRPLKIEFDDIDVRSRLFYKFPEQETGFRRRRNEFRQKALQLASAGSAESLPLLDHVLLWAVDDAECQAKKADILSKFPGLEAGAIDNLKDVFATFDSDGDGSISLDELSVAYRMLGYDLSPQLLREMVRIADIDGDGSINFSEFLGMILEQQNSSRLRSAQRTPPLTAEQVARYRDAFSSFDIDGDGTITVQELGTAMRLLGHNLSEAELRAMVRSADRDGSGTLDFGEFITFITRDQPQQQQHQQPVSVSVNLSQDQVLQYTNTFLIMDGDGDGGIDARELASAMRLLGKPLTVAEAQSLINEYDLDGSGTLNLVEYLLMMSGHHSQEEEAAAAAGAAPLRQFTQEELARYREVFESFDSNGDGKITLTEMYRALQLLQRGVPLDTLESIFRWLDKDNSGALEWPEFIRWLSESEDSAEATREEEQQVQHPAFSQEQVSRYRGLFNELDRDGDGRVDAQELRTLFLRAGETVTEEEVREFIQRVSPDGRFNFAQFLEAMAKGSQLDEQERAQPPQRQQSSNRGPPPSQQPQWQHSSSRPAPPPQQQPQRQQSSGRAAPQQPQRQPSSSRVAPPPPQQPQRQQSSSRPPPPPSASSRMSLAELTQMRAKFRLFDRDGDGRISIHELGTVLRLLGESPTQADLEAMIGAGDTDGSGTLDFEEFLQLMSLRS